MNRTRDLFIQTKLHLGWRLRALPSSRQDGQALVEYSLVLGLISVIAVLAMTTLGADVRGALETVAEDLAAI